MRYFGAVALDEAAVDLDFGRDCCGECCLATWAAVVAVLVVADLVEDSVAAGVEAGLADLAAGAQAEAGRSAVIRE